MIHIGKGSHTITMFHAMSYAILMQACNMIQCVRKCHQNAHGQIYGLKPSSGFPVMWPGKNSESGGKLHAAENKVFFPSNES